MTKIDPKDIKFIYFGSPDFSVTVLNILKEKEFLPTLIITAPDKPRGRKMEITSTPVKKWAKENKIKTWEPKTLKGEEAPEKLLEFFGGKKPDLGIVVSYGLIIPQSIIDIPTHGILNIHPSLLPRLRGASPIESAIIYEEKTGVSIMVIDEQMDHGPVLEIKEIETDEWPPYKTKLAPKLAELGGNMLNALIIPWINGEIKASEQDHNKATFCSKIKKEDTEIDPNDRTKALDNLRKIRAFAGDPYAFFIDKGKSGKEIRVKITKAYLNNNELIIERVIPEGRNEMTYGEYLRNIKS